MGGYLHLFNPSSTTFLKNFISVVNHSYPSATADVDANGQTMNIFTNGYINTASAILCDTSAAQPETGLG